MDPVAVRVYRGDVVESVHRASVAVSDANGRVVASFGNPRLVTFVRSSIKPAQALPLVEAGGADRFGFSSQDLAMICSSHSGEAMHVERVRSILERVGLGPDTLQCGAHAPYDKAASEAVGGRYSALHNNCSGKHAGMLAACVHRGWDVSTYLDPGHPLQRAILARVAEETGVPADAIGLGVDGCSAPNFALPLAAAARAFARLMRAEAVAGPRGAALGRIRDAMLAHPELVAGTTRTDTLFMRAFEGDVWVKAGGEACYGLGVRRLGLGVAVKVEDGSARAIPALLLRILEDLGVAKESHRKRLEGAWNEPLRNWAGKSVGRVECVLRLEASSRAAVPT